MAITVAATDVHSRSVKISLFRRSLGSSLTRMR